MAYYSTFTRMIKGSGEDAGENTNGNNVEEKEDDAESQSFWQKCWNRVSDTTRAIIPFKTKVETLQKGENNNCSKVDNSTSLSQAVKSRFLSLGDNEQKNEPIGVQTRSKNQPVKHKMASPFALNQSDKRMHSQIEGIEEKKKEDQCPKEPELDIVKPVFLANKNRLNASNYVPLFNARVTFPLRQKSLKEIFNVYHSKTGIKAPVVEADVTLNNVTEEELRSLYTSEKSSDLMLPMSYLPYYNRPLLTKPTSGQGYLYPAFVPTEEDLKRLKDQLKVHGVDIERKKTNIPDKKGHSPDEKPKKRVRFSEETKKRFFFYNRRASHDCVCRIKNGDSPLPCSSPVDPSGGPPIQKYKGKIDLHDKKKKAAKRPMYKILFRKNVHDKDL